MHIRHEALEIEAVALDLPTIVACFLQLAAIVAGVDHELLRDAAANDAGPANAVFFCDRNTRARLRGDPGRPDTA